MDELDEAPAVVHGMLSTMAEVLDRLDDRLSALEAAVARPDTTALETRIDTVVTAVTNSLADAIAGEVRSALQAARADATQGVARLADLLADRAVPEPAAALPAAPALDEAALGALLDERMAGVTSGIADLLAETGDAATLRAMARTLARVEAELAEARAEAAMAVQGVAERVERVVTDALVDPAPAVAERLAVLEAGATEARANGEEVLRRAVEAVEAMVATAARIESATAEGRQDGKGRKGERDRDREREEETLTRLADRMSQLQEAVNRSRGELLSAVEARATGLASELHTIVGAGMERLLTQASATNELLSSDVRSSLHRLGEVAVSVESMSGTVAGLAEQVGRLAADERTRPVLTALEDASREHQESIAALHTALVRRIDGRTSALARALDGVGDVGPVLQRLAEAADASKATADSVERAVAGLREDLGQEVGGLAKRQTAALRLLERVAGALEDEQRRLEGVQSLCQSVAGAVEQQAAVGGRVAELVMDTRSALRSDVERLESTVQLEAAKRQQHDQARLAQMASGVTDVVEREAALVAQRVATLASAVESLRQAVRTTPADEPLRVVGS